MARSLIAFTGGLDSTYVLHEELKKGHEVEVMYGAVSQGEAAVIAELTCRRRILEHFNKKFPNQLKDEWVNVNVPVHVSQIPSVKRVQIVQQSNTMLSLIQVMLSSDVSWYRPMTGWHYGDVLENDPNEGTSEESLDMLKNTFLPMLRLMDPARPGRASKLITPAWFIEKIEMWNSLDEWTQANICLDYIYRLDDRGNGDVLMSASIRGGSMKFDEYARQGAHVVRGVSASYGLLSDLDRLVIARLCTCHTTDLSLVKRCTESMKPVMGFYPLKYAVNPKLLTTAFDHARRSRKGED